MVLRCYIGSDQITYGAARCGAAHSAATKGYRNIIVSTLDLLQTYITWVATSSLVYDKNTMNMNQYYRIKKTSIDSDSFVVKGPGGLLSTSEAEVFGLWFWRDAIWHNLLVSLLPQGPGDLDVDLAKTWWSS